MNLEYIQAILPALLKGTWQTLQVFFLTLVLSLPLGLPFALGSISRFFPVRFLSKAYIWVFRGTPLMLQLFFVYYGLPIMFGPAFRMENTVAAVLTFTMNYAAYFAEIYRAGSLSATASTKRPRRSASAAGKPCASLSSLRPSPV